MSSRGGGGLKTEGRSTDVKRSDGERVFGALGRGPSRPPEVGRLVGVVCGAPACPGAPIGTGGGGIAELAAVVVFDEDSACKLAVVGCSCSTKKELGVWYEPRRK